MTSRLKEHYIKKAIPALIKEFKYSSVMQVPKLEKIVINVGAGDAAQNSKVIEDIVKEVGQIAGQRPVVTRARKSISNFKLRENMPIGVKVTLRGEKMYYFLDKLISISLPRVRDFRGVSKNALGNYTLVVKEQLIFPEIRFDDIKKIRGMDVVLVTTAKTNEEAFSLLKNLGMPFAK